MDIKKRFRLRLNISTNSIFNFKKNHCDENKIISTIIKKELLSYFDEPILDVGCGLGDISHACFNNKTVFLLDKLDFQNEHTLVNHTRIVGDFLDEDVLKKLHGIATIFMCHVQQFIDDDIELLNKCIQIINPHRIVTVDDLNNDFLFEVLKFSRQNFKDCNGEVQINGFPANYKLVKSRPFTATLECSDFATLAEQCIYLMDVKTTKSNKEAMKDFLVANLDKPKFTINQSIHIYERNS